MLHAFQHAAISAYMYIQTQNNSNRKREIISILT